MVNDDEEGFAKLRAAVAAGTNGGRVWGRTEARLRAVAGGANGSLEALCNLARTAGARSPVELVALLEQAEVADAAWARRADPERSKLESRLAALRATGDPELESEILEIEAALGTLEG